MLKISAPQELCLGTKRFQNVGFTAAMNWDRVQGNWNQFTGKAKKQWGKLTDDELAQINGNREQLEGKIQAKYGYAKDNVYFCAIDAMATTKMAPSGPIWPA
jgi:uncharacterized protein YjbJ (UPF0337 family)